MSPALAGGFFTTEQPGRPQGLFLPEALISGKPCSPSAYWGISLVLIPRPGMKAAKASLTHRGPHRSKFHSGQYAALAMVSFSSERGRGSSHFSGPGRPCHSATLSGIFPSHFLVRLLTIPLELLLLSCSVVSDSLWPHGPQHARLPCFHYLQEFAQTHAHWDGDAIQSPHPLLTPSPPAFKLSQHQGLFQWDSSLHRWPKYWSFSFSVSPSNEYSRLHIRIIGVDLKTVDSWVEL